MVKKIVFKFEFDGDVKDLTVYVNDELFEFQGLKGTYKNVLNTNKLKIIFQISGSNGTEYSITYSCTSDTVDKSDASNLSPVEGEIMKNGYKEEKLFILI